MHITWTETPRSFLETVEREVTALASCLSAPAIRVWRYDDSQKILFNCWPTVADAEPPYEDRFAFLRDPEALSGLTTAPVVRLTDKKNADGDYLHPLWHLVPDYHLLPKTTRKDYMESILVANPFKPGQSTTDLVGVVCIDAPYANYERLPDSAERGLPSKKRAEVLLSRLRVALRNYSHENFRAGLPLPEFPIGPRDNSVARRNSQKFLQEEIANLLDYMDIRNDKVSIYLRAISLDWDEVSLTGGFGDLYSALHIIEGFLRKNATTGIPTQLFSYHAWQEFEKRRDSNEPILFPGSGGDLKTYENHRDLFINSGNALSRAPEDEDDSCRIARAQVIEITRRIIDRGSFGVFPIRCLADSPLRGDLVGMVCIAVENRRNVFSWRRRQLIERFCRMVGRRHDWHIAPVLSRVSETTHKELIASPRTLRKLLDDPGPLVRRMEADADDRSCVAFVVSVDLRKSTELMLKVLPDRTRSYAREFMRFCEELRMVMRSEYGVFDKFTGDGVLAFFPAFFSGRLADAGYRAIRAAERCHKRFAQSYELFWPYLVSVPVPGRPEAPIAGSVGLGIGIDYGRVRLVNVGDELTIVGVPVVYACRLSGVALASTTLLNERAFHAIRDSNLLQHLSYTRASAGMKHEDGDSVAYQVSLKDHESYKPRYWNLASAPQDERTWLSLRESDDTRDRRVD